MKYYGGWSVFETYNLPIGLRNWFVKKLVDHMKEEADEIKKQQSKSSR